MKKYIIYVGTFIAVISNINGTISFINSLIGKEMALKDIETIIRIIVTFGIVYFLGWMYYGFKSKILALKKYNEEKFEVTLASLKTHLIENFKEHDDMAKIINKANPELKIEQGKEERIKELWDKIMKDFQKVKDQYNNEFNDWETK
jgi:hypothetical protein